MARIFLVEDNANMSHAITSAVKHIGHEVIASEPIEAALKQIPLKQYDLILLHIHAAHINDSFRGGLEVVHIARQHCPGLPIICISAGPPEHWVPRVRDLNVNCLPLPFDNDVLLATVEASLKHDENTP